MVGILVLVGLVAFIGLVAWLGSRSEPSGDGGDNRSAAMRYGQGGGH